ncbi:MAG: hypothetical protein ACUVTD_05860 [Nitrososphaerales archaeon]
MGEIVEADSKGRITIPAEIRKVIGKKAFKVELMGKDTLILKALEDRRVLVKKVANIKLMGDKEKAFIDASTIKDFYGGVKY